MSSPDHFHEPLSHWQSSAANVALRADELPATADVVVVGGGLLGVATLYWLARAGVAALLVERGELAAGATGRNGGIITAGTAEPYSKAIRRLGHGTARSVWALTLQGRRLLRQVLEEEQIQCSYREPGHLTLALGEEQRGEMGRTVAAITADGFAAELLDRDQAQELVGTPLADEIAGGVFSPGTGLVHSALLVKGLAQAAQRRGAHICQGVAVTGLQHTNQGVVLETDRGSLRAGAAVVAVNAWAGQLVPALDHMVTPVRGQVLAYEPLPPIFPLGMSAAITATGEYWQQTPDGTIVLGGCRAVAPDAEVGLRICQPHDAVQAALEQIFPRLFPVLDGLRVTRRWAGPMAFTRDYLPIVDRVPGVQAAWVVAGFSGHGMPFGMVLGQALAQAATLGAPEADLAPFRLDRATLLESSYNDLQVS